MDLILIDCFTLLLTEEQAEELKNSNDFLFGYTRFSSFAGLKEDLSYKVLCKIHFSDLLTDKYPNVISQDIFAIFDAFCENLQISGSFKFWHLELAIDLDLDFQEKQNLFQSFVLYFNKYTKGSKSVGIIDLERSLVSSFSSRKNNLQLVVYNKSFELLKHKYDCHSSGRSRLEFRLFNINLEFSREMLAMFYFDIVAFFRNYNPTIFEKIELDLSVNLWNNFQKQRSLYYKKVSAKKKFSIKLFLVSQGSFILSKRVLRLFYGRLKEENLVSGDFEKYFYKVLKDINFDFLEKKDLETFFSFIRQKVLKD